MKKIKFSLIMAVFGLGLFFLTTGCAAPLLMAIQPVIAGTITGGKIYSRCKSTKVSFVDEKISTDGRQTLSQINVLAIWPDNETEVFLAEKLQAEGVSVITPSKVAKVIRTQNFEQRLDNLTQSEILEVFQVVCEETKADAIIAWKKSRVMIYSVSKKDVVWSATTKVSASINSLGKNMPFVAEACAKKVVELIIAGDRITAELK